MREDEFGTHGVIRDDAGKILCHTIERPWLKNKREVSCIPVGEYQCAPYSSIKYPSSWEITGVPDRDKILIHSGNTMKDTTGCVVVGTFPAPEGVKMSKLAMEKLHEILPSHFVLEIFSEG